MKVRNVTTAIVFASVAAHRHASAREVDQAV